ncbi:hypothetical protein DFH09DRAFT_46827 [Mycena vulgaris]|nr:hypothetical protein DFH09DRAFT_46827 [Mycena vulgaris]
MPATLMDDSLPMSSDRQSSLDDLRLFPMTLPPELQREILEFVALSNPRSIPKLLLVAKHVKAWIEPLLYRVFTVADRGVVPDTDHLRITSRTFLKILDAKSPSFFQDHVRHVAMLSGATVAENQRILSKCSGIVGLGLAHVSAEPALLPVLARLPLVRLAVAPEVLFGSFGVDFGHAMFSRLTHLDLYYSFPSDAWQIGLSQIPNLTHLSFSCLAQPAFFRGVLAYCTGLEIFALVFQDVYSLEDRVQEYKFFEEDSRAVLMIVDSFLQDWELGAEGGDDHWVRADSFVTKRRNGAIKGEPAISGCALIDVRAHDSHRVCDIPRQLCPPFSGRLVVNRRIKASECAIYTRPGGPILHSIDTGVGVGVCTVRVQSVHAVRLSTSVGNIH